MFRSLDSRGSESSGFDRGCNSSGFSVEESCLNMTRDLSQMVEEVGGVPAKSEGMLLLSARADAKYSNDIWVMFWLIEERSYY